jgi:hypothetical protein
MHPLLESRRNHEEQLRRYGPRKHENTKRVATCHATSGPAQPARIPTVSRRVHKRGRDTERLVKFDGSPRERRFAALVAWRIGDHSDRRCPFRGFVVSWLSFRCVRRWGIRGSALAGRSLKTRTGS